MAGTTLSVAEVKPIATNKTVRFANLNVLFQFILKRFT